MRFSFLHSADLHLGSPLLGLSLKDPEIARRFAAASRQAFADLVTFAIEKSVAFLIIAGDCFDGEWKDSSIGLFFNRELARLDRAHIPVFLLKGNHDAESIVTKHLTLPPNVRQFRANKAETFTLDPLQVALHGRSFAERAAQENYAQTYPSPKPGWFNIGVLHTSCEGKSEHATYAPCSVEDLSLRNYDYWALGHVHAFEILRQNPHIVFSGNLQGRSIRECGQKGAVLVEIEDQNVKSIEHIPFDSARFGKLTIDLSGVEHEAEMRQHLEAALRTEISTAEARALALRVEFCGATSLHGKLKAKFHDFCDEVQAAADRLREDIWLEKLVLSTDEPKARQALAQTAMLDLAAMLEDLASDPDLHQSTEDILRQIFAKLPESARGADFGPSEIKTLIEEASALVLGRAFE
jgi:exonuclease SbcD